MVDPQAAISGADAIQYHALLVQFCSNARFHLKATAKTEAYDGAIALLLETSVVQPEGRFRAE